MKNEELSSFFLWYNINMEVLYLKKRFYYVLILLFFFSFNDVSAYNILGEKKSKEREIIVKFKDNYQNFSSVHSMNFSKLKYRSSDVKGLDIVTIGDRDNVSQVLQRYRLNPSVEYVELNSIYKKVNSANENSHKESLIMSHKEKSFIKNELSSIKNEVKKNNVFNNLSANYFESEPNSLYNPNKLPFNFVEFQNIDIFGRINNYYYDTDYYEINVTRPGTFDIVGYWSGTWMNYGFEDDLIFGIFDSNNNLIDVGLSIDEGQEMFVFSSTYLNIGKYNLMVMQNHDYRYMYVNEQYTLKTFFYPEENVNYISTDQWALNNFGQVVNGQSGNFGADIGVFNAWDVQKGKSSVIVAVLDTGIEYSHPDLSSNMWTNNQGFFGKDFVNDDDYPFDDEGHGTGVAGIIGAEGNNNIGIKGVMWDTRLMSVKVLDNIGEGYLSDIIKGIEYANNNGAKVINMSLSSSEYSQALRDIISTSPAIIVAAAGNEGTNIDNNPTYPASYDLPNIITVASINNRGNLSYFSNYGQNSVDIAAPGEYIFTTKIGNSYGFESGTSFAAPFVSGIAGLILSKQSDFKNTEVIDLIYKGATNPSALNGYVSNSRFAKAILNFPDYIGNINSELLGFNLGKNQIGNYVYGSIVVVEWVDGVSTVPKVKPIMKFKSTDGTVIKDLFITPTGTNTYYFDGFIDGIDITKEYYVEIESGDSNNKSTFNKMYVRTSDSRTLGDTNTGNRVSYINEQGQLKFRIVPIDYSYIGNINSELLGFNLGKNQIGNYVYGSIVVVEWVDGVSTVPKVKPIMKFKSTDGTVIKDLFITPTGTNTYYFDGFIDGIDITKEYYVEIESGDSNNKSTFNKMYVRTSDSRTLGDTNTGNRVSYINEQGQLKFRIVPIDYSYIGNINSELLGFNLGKNQIGNYVYGSIVVVEWVDGVSTVPKVKPIMKFKSTDGTVIKDLFITPTGTNTYYFDGFIDGIDITKEYYVEIESGDSNNKSTFNKMYVRTSDSRTLGDTNTGNRVSYISDQGQLKFRIETLN
jgi:subtilisin family serine protease/RNase P/RNase MRP subunit p29